MKVTSPVNHCSGWNGLGHDHAKKAFFPLPTAPAPTGKRSNRRRAQYPICRCRPPRDPLQSVCKDRRRRRVPTAPHRQIAPSGCIVRVTSRPRSNLYSFMRPSTVPRLRSSPVPYVFTLAAKLQRSAHGQWSPASPLLRRRLAPKKAAVTGGSSATR